MTHNTSVPIGDIEKLGYCSAKISGLSTSFTITFEDDVETSPNKLKKNKNSKMFVRGHVRTLSLPATCDKHLLKDVTDLEDPLIENQGTEYFGGMNNDLQKPVLTCTNGSVTNTLNYSCSNIAANTFDSTSLIGDKMCSNEIETLNEDASSNDSEGGTYTLDKNNHQVLLARKSIDQVFGIIPNNVDSYNASIEKMRNKNKMIDEWVEQSVSALKSADSTSVITSNNMNTLSKSKQYVSKIPSPMIHRRVLSSERASSVLSNSKSLSSSVEKKAYSTSTETKRCIKLRNSSSSEEIDTESYLKETEDIVVALQSRLQEEFQPNKCTNAPDKETNKYANTRFNRAFSLRRDKSKKILPATSSTAIPVRKKNFTTTGSKTCHSNDTNGISTGNGQRTFLLRDSVRSKKLPASASSNTVTANNESNLAKGAYQRSKTSNSRMRSNSSLSVQEIEFQNWKRRKNYDPLKAVAEDKKKKSVQSPIVCVSSMASPSTRKEKLVVEKKGSEFHEKIIIRSASFHGLRNKTKLGRCTSFEDNDVIRLTNDRFISSVCLSTEHSVSSDIPCCDDDNEWVIPKPPSITSTPNAVFSYVRSLPDLPESGKKNQILVNMFPVARDVLVMKPDYLLVYYKSLFLIGSRFKVNLATLASITHLSHVIKMSLSSFSDLLRSNDDKIGCFETNKNGLPASPEDMNYHVLDRQYHLHRNCAFHDSISNDLGDVVNDFEQLSIDHQLKLTLDNLTQIHITVQAAPPDTPVLLAAAN